MHWEVRRELVAKALLTIAAFADREVTAPMLEGWVTRTLDIPEAQLAAALEKLVATWPPPGCSRAFPMPGDLRAIIEGAQRLRDSCADEAAWQKVLHLAPDLGSDYTIASARQPDDAVLLAAVRAAGGWHHIATCTNHELQFARRTFLEVYARQQALPEAEKLLVPGDLSKQIAELAERKALPGRSGE